MKLKYLEDNRDLAMTFLEKWGYDKDRLDIINKFRISSNAVYPFYNNNAVRFLRFAPISEKLNKGFKSELLFLDYLKDSNYPVGTPILSYNDLGIESIDRNDIVYEGVAFGCVDGDRMDRIELTTDHISMIGEMLGRLHQLSANYVPTDIVNKRCSYEAYLQWMVEIATELEEDQVVLREIELCTTTFKKIEQTTSNYGLVHYDFELDNLFFNESTKEISVIDFDDAMYHWYYMDIVKTIDNIVEECPEYNIELVEQLIEDGYSKVYAIDPAIKTHKGWFVRFSELYSYIRCVRSIYEKYDNEPEWILGLRTHLKGVIKTYKNNFRRKQNMG